MCDTWKCLKCDYIMLMLHEYSKNVRRFRYSFVVRVEQEASCSEDLRVRLDWVIESETSIIKILTFFLFNSVPQSRLEVETNI